MSMFISGDQLRKGAALNAVQIGGSSFVKINYFNI